MTEWDKKFMELPNPTKQLDLIDDKAIDRIASAAVWALTLIAVALSIIPVLALYQAYAH